MDAFLLRRRMIMAQTVSTERLLYSLSNYTCDGTINTFIDTGIRLFSREYESFRIELKYENFDLSTQIDQETILECKRLVGNTAGLTVRCGRNTEAHLLEINASPLLTNSYFANATTAEISVLYNGFNNNITVNGATTSFNGSIIHFDTLTIGGRYASVNNPDRFVSCHIISLKVYVTLAGWEENTIFSLRDYTCDGTEATAINTGVYLFDTSLYPNGWVLQFDFTVGENNVALGSYLRCRNSANPYPGFGLRRNNNNASQAQAQVNNSSQVISAAAGTRHNVIITNDLTNIIMYLDGNSTYISQQTPANVISPLVIGGELSNDSTQVWNTSRFGKIYIHSLLITAL